jgi:hypothetical protein
MTIGTRFFAPPGVGVNEEPTIPGKSGEELDEVKINEGT